MTNHLGNATCNAVTHAVLNNARRNVQNQNQNQTVFKASCGSSLANQVQSVKAVEAHVATDWVWF